MIWELHLKIVNTRPTFHTLLKSIPNPYFDWSAWIFRPSWSDCQSSLHICVTWEANKKFAAGEKHVGSGQKGRRRPAWIHYSLVEFLPQNGPHGVDLDLTNFGRTFSVSRGRGSTHKSNSINYHSQVLCADHVIWTGCRILQLASNVEMFIYFFVLWWI